MTPYEITMLIILGLFLLGFGSITWVLHKGLIRPLKEQEKAAKSIIYKDVEKAKIELGSYKAETRMDSKVEESEIDDSLEKLKQLRRK